MTNGPIQPPHVLKLIIGSMVLISAFLLKTFYSQASSDDLLWIIGPTAYLTETFSSLSFIREPGYGWVDFDQHVVIAPACAGVNFLIISFCMSSFQILWRRLSLKELITWIIIAGCASLVLTVIANTARITLSVTLFRADIYSELLTPGSLHRISGTGVYYTFLCLYCCLINFIFQINGSKHQVYNGSISKQLILISPLFWYLSFSLCLPIVNNSIRTFPDPFLEHALTVSGIAIMLTLLFCLLLNGFILLWLAWFAHRKKPDSGAYPD